MSIDSVLEELNTYLEQDGRKIIDLLDEYKTKDITKKSISLHAFDKAISFAVDPVKGNPAYEDLKSKGGNYIFVMASSYTKEKNFNNVYYGAPLKDTSVCTFDKGKILYVGTAKSIISRMHQHFEKDSCDNHTGSLKLGADNRKSILGSFVVYAFCIKDKYMKFYSIIGPKVEKYLHEKLDVLIGND